MALCIFTPSLADALASAVQYNIPGQVKGVKLAGNHLFVSCDDGVFRVIDVTNALQPLELGFVGGLGAGGPIEVGAGVAYVASGTAGLAVIAISDLSHPALVGTIAVGGRVRDLAIEDSLLFVAADTNGLLMFSLANPRSPVLISRYRGLGSAQAIDVWGKRLYLADGTTSLKALDITDPNTPFLLTTLPLGAAVRDLEVQGHNAYVRCTGGRLYTILLAWPSALQVLGSVQLPISQPAPDGVPNPMCLRGNYVLTGENGNGLFVVDISNETAPVTVGTLPIPGTMLGMDADAAYAFMAADTSDVQVVSAAEYLTFLSLVGSRDTPGVAMRTKAMGGTLYVADFTGGMRLMDVSNPTSPTETGSVNGLGFVYDVDYHSGYAYCAADTSGIGVVNVTNRSAPNLVRFVYSGETVYRISISGTLLASANLAGGVSFYDLADPSRPAFLGKYDTQGMAASVQLVGNRAVVGDYGVGILLLDVSSPSSPQLLGSLTGLGNVVALRYASPYIYAAVELDGLHIIDAGNPSKLNIVGHCSTQHNPATTYPSIPPLDVELSGNYAFVADGDSGFVVIDVRDKADPYIVDTRILGTACWGIDVCGEHAFAAAGSGGVKVVGVDGYGSRLSRVGQFDTPGSGYTLAVKVRDNLLFQCEGISGLGILDITNPMEPVEIGRANGASWIVYAVDFLGDYAYVAARTAGVAVLNVANPASPLTIRTVATVDAATDVKVYGTRLYVADRAGGLLIYSLANPANPAFLGKYDSPSLYNDEFLGVDIVDNLVYVANYWRGLTIVNVSNPAAPLEVANLNIPWLLWHVVVRGNYAYCTGEGSGLQIVDCSNLSSLRIVGSAYMPDEEMTPADAPPFLAKLDTNYAFVGDGLSGLQVVCIGDVTSPKVVDSIQLPGYCWGVDFKDNYVYVGGFLDGLHVVDAAAYLDPDYGKRQITLTSPNGGENWAGGTTQTITWQWIGDIGPDVKLKLFKGAKFLRWISGPTPNTGGYVWQVPDDVPTASNYSVQVYSASDFSVIDMSDQVFSINAPPLRLNAPNGGELWAAGTTQNITWVSNIDIGPEVKLKLFRNGAFMQWISGPTPNDGSYSWKIPADQAVGNDFTIQIYSASNFSYIDTSNAPFSIVPQPLKLIYPNGGEALTAGARISVLWQAAEKVGPEIKLKLFKNGKFLRWISGPTPNDGVFGWTLPTDLVPASDYTVQIYSATDFSIIDFSDFSFTILGP